MKYHPQDCIRLAPGATFVRPPSLPKVVRLDDPALEVMTDFNYVPPVTVRTETPIDEALELMKFAGVRSQLVIESDESIVGLITSYDIQGEKPIELARESRIPRTGISVGMIMTPSTDINVLDLDRVRRLQIGHIVETLQELERQHLLVVEIDAASGHQKVCGLFSMSQIQRQLAGHADQIRPHHHPTTVAELAHARGGG